jgi:ribosomal protein L11 methyltransferase
VLDVGTGTGVLARIARARGASFVVGTDIDPAALESAAAHAALDSATTAGGPRTAASAPGDFTPRSAATPHRATTTRRAAAIEFAAAPPDAWGPRFDIVVANILERPLLDMAPQLAAAMRPASLLLLSGFTRPQSPALKVRFTRAGLSLAAESFLEDWVLLHFASPRS